MSSVDKMMNGESPVNGSRERSMVVFYVVDNSSQNVKSIKSGVLERRVGMEGHFHFSVLHTFGHNWGKAAVCVCVCGGGGGGAKVKTTLNNHPQI